jgi:hypothetical protein
VTLDMENPLRYFGGSWGVPMLEGATEAPTPVGQSCAHCGEPIVEGDQGVIRPPEWGWQGPEHKECDARHAIGGLNHVLGRCSCAGGSEPPDPPELTKREAALAAWAAFQERMQ